MLQQINPAEVKRRIFVYGENGAGKTRLALTAPGKKLVVDWFGNVIEVCMKDFPKQLASGEIKVVKGPNEWKDIDQMVKAPLDPLIEECDVFIMDNLTGLYRETTEDVAKNVALKSGEGARPSPELVILRDYGLAAERLRYVMGKVMDNIKPTKHIIAIAHTKLNKDKEGAVISGNPSLPGEVPAFVLSLFPEQIYLRATQDKVRHAHLTHTGLFPAATRLLDGNTVDNPDLSKMYQW
jgi:hypothetical protein